VVCGAAAWIGAGLVASERELPLPFVAGIESWVPMLVLPVGFGLLALRFLVGTVAPRPEHEGAP
jgi:TRAP-type C4-dicarboxylate transport system permease small subunit